MRYRRLDEKRDYVMGRGAADMLRDTPEAVAQAVGTRLRLLSGEWFLDLQEGTPFAQGVFGKHTRESYDPIIQDRIRETEGVRSILAYDSQWDGETRKLTVSVTIDTVYGPTILTEVL